MAVVEEDDLLEEEEEEGKKEEEKKGLLSEKWIKLLTYVGLFLGVILVAIISAYLVYELKKDSQVSSPLREGMRPIARPKGVYELPEFKLALDKEDEESMSTIVQVKLGLAYIRNNQKIIDEIIKRKEQIIDRVQFVIARKKYEDINRADRREKDLKEDLKTELNKIMQEGEIEDIYFDTFVISRVPG
ncbi:MAG: flagellar basal body-associated FliL family protein [Spirochaetota bacterium]|nr:flagellar basal body-associated FliL family protein [Spirochaetota bacterium]